jgi:hypothetical protein
MTALRPLRKSNSLRVSERVGAGLAVGLDDILSSCYGQRALAMIG